MSTKRNDRRTAHQVVANDRVMEQDLDFRFLRAPKKSERQADQLLLSEQDKLLRSAFSLRSEATKNPFKALGLFLCYVLIRTSILIIKYY